MSTVIAHAWSSSSAGFHIGPVAVLGVGLLVVLLITYDAYRRHLE